MPLCEEFWLANLISIRNPGGLGLKFILWSGFAVFVLIYDLVNVHFFSSLFLAQFVIRIIAPFVTKLCPQLMLT